MSHIRRRSATTRLVVDALCVLQNNVGVLSELECGADMRTSGNAARIAISRSKFVICPYDLVANTKSSMTSRYQGLIYIMLRLDLKGSIHTPSSPRYDASQKPVWVGS